MGRTAKDLFLEAIDLEPPDRRAAFLDDACAGDAALRQRVEALLEAHRRPESLLDRDALDASPTLVQAIASPAPFGDSPGSVFGPYRLLERIGEGGMGTVYMAEQAEPVHRRVALKVVKAGMDSEAVLARFDAERQALALMDHPNIARVLEAGATPADRPYFVMELVRGLPITHYCDEARLSLRQRLELFIPVCRAIQHAHQKGIIHRDIKPSNVLVTLIDGEPVPKVIDFGIAKATDQRLTERTLFTRFGSIVGTPEYMSPEQAALSGQDVDTRSDVYSLGVLLYEMLTGSTPLERESLRRAALEEVLRRVREEEPPKPSTRLSGTGDRLPSVAAVRGVEPARLARLVRGDLDWMVMKALEKDRSRRYETADALAVDLQRHLDGDPVQAGPPSRTYRLSKFARKYRVAMATAGAFVVLLVIATAFSSYQAWLAAQAEGLARKRLEESNEARVQADAAARFLVELFRSPDPRLDGREVRVAHLLDRAVARLDHGFAGSSESRGFLLSMIGETYKGLGLYEQAASVYRRALAVFRDTYGADHPLTLPVRSQYALAMCYLGKADEAIADLERVAAIQESKLGPDDPETLICRHNLAVGYLRDKQPGKAIATLEKVVARWEATLGPDDPRTIRSRGMLVSAYSSVGRPGEAIATLEKVVARWEATLGPDDPETLNSCTMLALAYLRVGRVSDAIAVLQRVAAIQEAKLGPNHGDTLRTLQILADAYKKSGRSIEAMALLEGLVKRHEAVLGHHNPQTLVCRNSLAHAYWQAGRLDRSVPQFEQLLRQSIAVHGPDNPITLMVQANLGINSRDAGRREDGARLMEEALRRARAKPESGAAAQLHWLVPELASTYLDLRRWQEAEPLIREELSRLRASGPPDSPALAAALVGLGLCLLERAAWAEAEPLLRECLKIRTAMLADDWSRFNVMSRLGVALLGQGRYEEAEPLIVGGYEGLKAREAAIPAAARERLPEAADVVVQLYENWGKPEQVASWRARLGQSVRELPDNVFARP